VRSDSPDSSHKIVAELYKELLRSSYSHESMRVINNWNMQIFCNRTKHSILEFHMFVVIGNLKVILQ